jgi:hypothetical protein
MQELQIYTIKALAEIENYSYQHLRTIVAGFNKEALNTWRNYCLFYTGSQWLAYESKEAIKIAMVR